MDQDSVPFEGTIERLLAAHAELEQSGHPVGCVGPRLIDKSTSLQHGFHRIEGWRWVRVFPTEEDRTPISCSNMNGSGTLLKAELFRKLGGLDEAFFIDHVDTEWSFRVLASGYLLYGIPDARFDHAMGEKGLRFWCFGWRVWPQRSPFRHYYLFRNALWLMRRSYVPRVWKSWATIKLGLTLLLHGIGDPLRKQQVSKMGTGIWHGIRRVPESIPGQRLV
jgi:rhamnosyltransferase